MSPELKTKLNQVRALLKAHKADAALLGLQPNFSWLACGGEAHIPLNSNLSFGQLVVTARGFHLFANRIELRCLQDEVVKGLGAEPLLWEWHDSASGLKALKSVANPAKTLSDCGDWGTTARPELFLAYRDVQRAYRDERWKLIRYPQVNVTQLFDLQADPHEMKNLANDLAFKDRLEELRYQMMTMLKEEQDPRALELRLVQLEPRLWVAVLVEAPVVEGELPVARALDPLQELLGNDRVRIHIRSVERCNESTMYCELFHDFRWTISMMNSETEAFRN